MITFDNCTIATTCTIPTSYSHPPLSQAFTITVQDREVMNASGLRDGTLDQGVHLLERNVTLCTAVNTSGKAAILTHTPLHTSASLLTLVHLMMIDRYTIGGKVLARDGRVGTEVHQCYQYV